MSDLLKSYPPTSVVTHAYAFAEEAHRGVVRASGEPYMNHPLAVAETVRDWHLDEASVAAALLHDVVEDTSYTQKDIEKRFGEEVAFLVGGLTKLDTLRYPEAKAEVENFRKLALSFSKDLRVLLVKLADRLHNMRTLKFLSPERQKRIAWETTEIYAPLAYRLGMQKLSGELDDLALPYIHPEEYRWLIDTVDESYAERLAYTERVTPIVERTLHDQNIVPLQVDARAKRYSSLHKKLLRHEMNLEKIYDLVAIRIVVADVATCYATLGAIHHVWPPLPGRFKDYIARPKPNGYRSLHTIVFCVDNHITEFQIRTPEMHEEAELGIAAHWAYQQAREQKRGPTGWKGVASRKELVWVEQLRNWQRNFGNPEEFMESMKVEFFKDRIFALTPENDVVDLPAGSTPVDFAYRIHSEVGSACVGSKVNGKIVPLDYTLSSGDVVEIITQKGKRPSESWLRFVKTSMAKKHIKGATRPVAPREPERREEAPHTEFRIANRDRPGYLKEITAAFAEQKVNITFLQSQTDPRMTFSTVTVRTETLPKEKIERLLVRLRKIPATREVSYKVNR